MLSGLVATALLLLQTGDPVDDPVVVVREAAAAPERPLRDAAFPELLAALGDDGVAGNAEAACLELLARGADARPHLGAALAAEDPQRRFLAAWALAFVGPTEPSWRRSAAA